MVYLKSEAKRRAVNLLLLEDARAETVAALGVLLFFARAEKIILFLHERTPHVRSSTSAVLEKGKPWQRTPEKKKRLPCGIVPA